MPYLLYQSTTDTPVYLNICKDGVSIYHDLHMSHVIRKPAFCICQNKGTDQLCGNRPADQCLCFRLHR